MKRTQAIASGMTIAAALLLAGCGGGGSSNGGSVGGGPGPGTGSATVGGSISGLTPGITLLLMDKNADIISPTGNGNFTFDATVHAGAQYDVTLFTQPSGYTCTIANAQGTIDNNADAVTNVSISCQSTAVALLNYNVGATVSGLAAGNSVTLLLHGSNPMTVTTNGLAVFPETLSAEEVFPPGPVVAVGTNPSGQTCTVSGTPTATSNYQNVVVACQ